MLIILIYVHKFVSQNKITLFTCEEQLINFKFWSLKGEIKDNPT
jgi:hypothetical protein